MIRMCFPLNARFVREHAQTMPKCVDCDAACGTAGTSNLMGLGFLATAVVLPYWVTDGDGHIGTGLWQDCGVFPEDCEGPFRIQDISNDPGTISYCWWRRFTTPTPPHHPTHPTQITRPNHGTQGPILPTWIICYTLGTTKFWGYIGFTRSVRLPSVRPSRIPCPLCSAYSSGWIHLILIHLIKQL